MSLLLPTPPKALPAEARPEAVDRPHLLDELAVALGLLAAIALAVFA